MYRIFRLTCTPNKLLSSYEEVCHAQPRQTRSVTLTTTSQSVSTEDSQKTPIDPKNPDSVSGVCGPLFCDTHGASFFPNNLWATTANHWSRHVSDTSGACFFLR